MAQSKKRTRKVFKPLAIAALMAGSVLQPFMLPAFAAAGDQISNTATATYEDDEGTTFETESNTVTVTINEVAGITVDANGVDDLNDGSYEAGDILDFSFIVTNVGNDRTNVQLPALADIFTENFLLADTGAQTVPAQVEVFQNGVSVGTYSGTDAPLLVSAAFPTAVPMEAGDTIEVIITGAVPNSDSGLPALNPGAPITVRFGDTTPPDNQNQITDGSAGSVATVDLVDPANPAAPGALEDTSVGAPDNEKEASDFQTVEFATEPSPLALVTITKTDSSVDPGPTGAANDDVITYELGLSVASNSANGDFEAEHLSTTPIRLDQGAGVADAEVVLVSDVIPEFTELAADALGTSPVVTAPGGWQAIYSYSDPASTIPVIAPGATAAEWTTTAPATAAEIASVKRVGFIQDPLPTFTAPETNSQALDMGDVVPGFTFDVVTSGLPAAGGTIYNLAQVFGSTYDDPTDPNDPVDQIIYDESGDSNPNNFELNQPPVEPDGSDPDGSAFDPTEDTGEADPTNHGVDDGPIDNDGVGPDGEDNVVVLTGEELTGDDNILNGPDGSPDAVATDDDDDYTNKGINPADSDTATVEFTNTVANPTSNLSEIDNVTLVPISTTVAAANDEDPATDPAKYGDDSLIPNGTTATIDYDPTPGTPGDEQQAIYTWNDTTNAWDFTSSTGTPVANGPVNVGTLLPGEEVDYTVTLDFPELLAEGEIISVPIIAFPDTGNDGFTGESVNNITVDRIYVGFMTVEKEVRILDADGVTELQPWGTDLDNAESGNIIEYRLTYTNISPTAIGSGNVSLTAENFQLIEDGDIFDRTGTAGDNNWYSNTDPLTLHANGVVVEAGTTVTYYDEFDDLTNTGSAIGTADPATGAPVEAYVNEVGTVIPGDSGVMTFRRQIQ